MTSEGGRESETVVPGFRIAQSGLLFGRRGGITRAPECVAGAISRVVIAGLDPAIHAARRDDESGRKIR